MSCEYGKENREMIKELQKAVLDITNHYSQRLPAWATIMIAVLTAICGALIGKTL
jgi:hypothetical protein